MAEKCIGTLTLNTDKLKTQIEDINKYLSQIGVGVNLSNRITNEIKKQLKAVEDEIKKSVQDIQEAAQKATDAFNTVGNGSKGLGSLNSEITQTTSLITTIGREADASGKTVEKVIGETRSGFNSLGIKMKEITDASGNITRKVVDMGSQYKDALKIMTDYYSKSAQLYNLDQNGKTNSPQYAKLVSEVNELQAAWTRVPDGIKQVVASTQEAQNAASLYNKTIAAVNAGISDESAKQALADQIHMWELYYKYKSQSDTYAQKGNIENADMYNALADGIKTYIDAIAKVNPALDQQAQAEERVIQAHLKYEETIRNNATAEQAENVKKYKDALIDLYNAQTKLNNSVASGSIKEGSEEYNRASENIKRLEKAAAEAGQGLTSENIKMVNSMREVQNASGQLAQSQARMFDSSQISPLEQAEAAYKKLTISIKEYTTAQKAKDENGMAYWKEQISGAMDTINAIKAGINSLHIDKETREQILSVIERATTEQNAFTAGVYDSTNASKEMESTINSMMTRMFSLVAIIRTISNLIKNTTEYVSEYYDKMNEIRIITGKTESEAEKLGQTYRDLAASMSASSLDMADAAIYFTRQGLGAEEIEKRLKNTTMFAKAANVEFEQAAELITAVVNSMDLVEQEAEDGRNATQRVADVFLEIGDHAATSGREIGEAMQKAAAAAGAFGVEFEWIASYIATVSETTRQEATTIGTAFNTIIARLHSIRTAGYNQEDETKINDVQKALAKINVSLMDQEGNWRDITDVFNDVSRVWDTLDGKTKSYIATTMAGVKQQNVFLALMEDLSKSVEGQSRAWELHNLAVNSAGTAEQKYAIYTENVTAAQERLTAAQEQFYSLMSGNVIKDWYNSLTGVVTMINNGTKALNGWNIYIPLIVGGVTALVLVLWNLKAVLVAITANPVVLAIAGITAGVVALTMALSAIGDSIDTTKEKFDRANAALEKSQERIRELSSMKTGLDSLFGKLDEQTVLLNTDLEEYSDLLDKIAKISPQAKENVDKLRKGFGDQREILEELNDEVDEYLKKQNEISIGNMLTKYSNWEPEKFESGTNEAKQADLKKAQENWMDFWYKGETGEAGFKNALKIAYARRNDARIKSLPEEIANDIEAILKSLDDSFTEDEKWGIVAKYLYGNYIEQGEKAASNHYKEQAEAIVDDVVSVLGYGLDEIQQKGIKRNLINALIGDDDEVSEAEYKSLGENAAKFIAKYYAEGLAGIFSDTDTAAAIGESLFGDKAKGYFEAAGEAESVNFLNGYRTALEAGFSDKEIAEIFKQSGAPIQAMSDIGEVIADTLMDGFARQLGHEGSDALVAWNDAWGDLDLTTLKLIKDYTDLGVEIFDIDELLANSTSPEDFANKLKELAASMGVVEEEAEKKTFADYAKEIKSYASEIKKIDTITKNIKEGKAVDINDIFDIATSHPEILQFTTDAATLETALQGVKEKIADTTKETARQAILDSEELFQKTEYYHDLGEEVMTYGEYLRYIREELGEDSEEYRAVNDEIDRMVNGMVDLQTEQEKAATDTDFTKQIKTYLSDIETIDNMIAKIGDGKGFKTSELLSITTDHPELLQYIDDIDLLKTKLAELREETAGKIYDSLMGSEQYFKTTPYYQALDDAQKQVMHSLNDYIGSLEGQEDEQNAVEASVRRLVASLLDLKTAQDDGSKTTESLTKEIKSATQEMDKLDKMIASLKKNGQVDFEDLLNLAAAHPEIMGAITDVKSLIAALDELKKQNTSNILGNLRSMMSGSKEAFIASPFAGASWRDEEGNKQYAQTMQDILDHADQMGSEMVGKVQSYLDNAVMMFVASSDQLGYVSKDILGQWMNNLFPESNVDLLNRKAVEMGEDIATVLSETITASADGHEGIVWNQDVICNFTPITPDGQKLDNDAFYRYIEDLFANSGTINDLFENDKIENGGKGLLISADVDFESFEEGIANAEALMQLLHLLQEAYYGVNDANKTWLETQWEQVEATEANNWAKENGYVEQLSELQNVLNSGGAQAAIDWFDKLDETMKKGIASTYPGVLKALRNMEKELKDDANGTKDLRNETEALNKELKKSKDYAGTKYFKDSAKAIKDLEEGTISATDAYEIFNKECNKVTKAEEDIADVTKKMKKHTEVTASDVSNLAGVLGMTADEVINNFPGAVDMFNELISAGGDLEAMFNALNEAAFIRITGVSECDFSALQNGLLSVQNMAQETIDMLIATGQWELDSMELKGETWVIENGKLVKKQLTGYQQVLKPTGNNPYKGKSGGGSSKNNRTGGGGGGGNKNNSTSSKSSNAPTEVERMLDIMSQVFDIQEYQQSYYQSQQKYYEQTGKLQGVIACIEREKELLLEQNKVLEQNVKEIEEYMYAKREEVAAMSITDDAYKDAADDLDKLQKAHQKYTKELIDNKTAIDELNKSIKEQQKKIRQMEIDLRNTILQAIRDREEKVQNMLSNEIEMENTILDLIKRRYEKERDQIIDTTNLKINSLKEERDLLDEQLQLRKEEAEMEDKAAKLALLEDKYARISADPTRQKEALDIRKQINDLRKEMAWDTAEKEVKAQQESIDQQVMSLEDYIEYVENYYEDLFEHPQKLIEEMKDVISKSNDEIIEWLKANSEEYIEATENSQKQMVQTWSDVLLEMRGELKLYWDEVEEIISKGDEYIIEFLKENSAEYAEAGRLQAEAYVEEWQEQLENLKAAHEAAAAEIAASYASIEMPEPTDSDSGSGSSSGGSGGSRSSGGGGVKKDHSKDHYSTAIAAFYNERGLSSYSGEGYGSSVQEANAAALADAKAKGHGSYYSPGSGAKSIYARGGYADYTGLAWMDGTKTNPEAVLNPYQTKLFESMVAALEQMSRVAFPSMPNYNSSNFTGGGDVTFGDIVVNVEHLDSDADYEEMADRVGEIIMERVGRTSVVGGIRISSF